jgi:plasmid stabilization system protein ParE
MRVAGERAHARNRAREFGPGLRTIGFEKRVTILFAVDEDIARVEILGVFYGGRKVAAD